MPKPTSLLFILVLCVAGYHILNKIHRSHYSLKRSNGYHTFLVSMSAGLLMCGLSVIVYAIFDKILCSYNYYFSVGDLILNGVLKFNSEAKDIAIFDVCIITIIMCVTFPLCLYKFSLDQQYYCFLEEFAQDGESPEFTQLFFRSFQFGLPILFTMSDRKIYIGYVTEIYAKPFNDIHIIPLISGYRDSVTHKLVPVTPYQDIIHDVENDKSEDVDFEAFTVTLPLREIVYAHLHDFEKYQKFKDAEKNFDYSQSTTYTFTNRLDPLGY